METEKYPSYGNWVSANMIRKFIAVFVMIGIVDAALWFLEDWLWLKILFAFFTVFILACIVYFHRARRWFAADGGDIQNKVLDLLVSYIHWNGNGIALDIGCGSGALTIRLAKKYDEANITGVDYWGGGWGYGQKQCEENAVIEGVADRTEFRQASAAKLPFSDDSFDLVVSNLTFHEVRDSKSKLDLVKEALRVLKRGGGFVFQDLFLLKSFYGTTDELTAAVRTMGVNNLHFVDTSKSSFIPKALKLPFMVGAMGLLYGEKQ
jgi:SAM-dependent methyltransferase